MAQAKQRTTKPTRLTALVISDTEPGAKTWQDEIDAVAALVNQDIDENINIWIIESSENQHVPVPDSLMGLCPSLKVLYVDSQRTEDMKDYGISQCETEWVLILDADCQLDTDCLRLMMEGADNNSDCDIFCGRTNYGEHTMLRRVLNLFDRAIDDHEQDGRIFYIANNVALYRTAVIRNFPYKGAPTTFTTMRDRLTEILKADVKIYYVHDALVRHAMFLSFIPDYRREVGFANTYTRDHKNLLTSFRAVAATMKKDAKMVMERSGRYWRWYDWPLGITLYFGIRIPELYGAMEAALGRDGPNNSQFR